MLPKHLEIGLVERTVSVTAIAAATALLGGNLYRIATAPAFPVWWLVPVAILGMVVADFLSGVVHWAADTWGRADMPVLGPRLLHPFRVHHANPDDFLRRSFIDTNGDVAVLVAGQLAAVLFVPLDSAWGLTAAVFLVSFGGLGLLTNQIHQWAHMPRPPAVVRVAQDCRLILGRTAHARHHRPPFAANYCITTGWCNRPLAAIDFFRRLEAVVTRLTGLRPRTDDAEFSHPEGPHAH